MGDVTNQMPTDGCNSDERRYPRDMRGGGALGVGAEVHDFHGGAGNQATFFILNYSGDRACVGGLTEYANRHSRRREEQRRQEGRK